MTPHQKAMRAHRTAMSDRAIAFLAKKRVPLGFVTTIAALILARPTWTTWRYGLLVALAGEAIRVWAAGHLEKGREVTSSGPYRWTGHPLYVGSSDPRAGCRHRRVERAAGDSCRDLYGDDDRRGNPHGRGVPAANVRGRVRSLSAVARCASSRRFSLERVMRNREYRAAIGLVVGFALLALKVMVPI